MIYSGLNSIPNFINVSLFANKCEMEKLSKTASKYHTNFFLTDGNRTQLIASVSRRSGKLLEYFRFCILAAEGLFVQERPNGSVTGTLDY
jgi:hypothetical protein